MPVKSLKRGLLAAVMVTGCYEGGDEPMPDPGPIDPGEDDPQSDGGNDDDDDAPAADEEEECVETEEFFREEVWAPFMSTTCLACHNPAGTAKHTDLVLQQADVPGYLEANLATLKDVARLEIEGTSLLLLKPSAQVEHEGQAQIAKGDDRYKALKELIKRLDAPVHCANDDDVKEFFKGVELLEWEDTLRRAMFALVSRYPTEDELIQVKIYGKKGVKEVLREAMYDAGFYTRLIEMFNDMLLTDAYLPGTAALDLLDANDYPNKAWYGEDTTARNRSNDALAREPLELIRYVVEHDMPFSEIVAADFTVANGYLARVYGLDTSIFADPNDPGEWHPVKLEGIPHAGVLSTPAFTNRYPTTDTNRNRGRALRTLQYFLATDVMRLGARPIDGADIADHNPTMFDPACISCHEILDPVAGSFGNWDAQGRYRPGPWYEGMRPPGLGTIERPAEDAERSLAWLGEQIAADDRFGRAVVQALYTGLTGQKPVAEPTDPTTADYAAQIRAFSVQDHVFKEIAADFVKDGDDVRTAIIQLVISPYFRASNAEKLGATRKMELADVGAVRLVTPEQLHRRIINATGFAWVNAQGQSLLPLGRSYHSMYGGIDSATTTERLSDLNGVMANIAERMANETACIATAADFSIEATERNLFPFVDIEDIPEVDEEAIRDNIVYLHERLLGETFAPNDKEIDATYELFVDVRADGLSGIAAGEYATTLVAPCQAVNDPATGEPLPLPIIEDPQYTVRAWMAVTSAMLADYKFLLE